MSAYDDLAARLAAKDVVILDGAVGTQLQAMGVPMSGTAWAATALQTHPYTVRRMHELYIEAGAEIVTTNTYASARHNLEPLGMGDLVAELNIRAVLLAKDARDKAANGRRVFIAGSVSNFGLLTGSEDYSDKEGWAAYFANRSELTEAQCRANLREQADLLAEAGVDFLLAEATGSTAHRRWVVDACVATGLPVWAGFKCHQRADDATVRMGYCSDDTLDGTVAEIMGLGPVGLAMFHTVPSTTTASLPIVRDHWDGPVAVYPEAERHDYVAAYRDPEVATTIGPAEFVAFAQDAVAQGVQIVGGCCGIELDHIRALKDALPSHVA